MHWAGLDGRCGASSRRQGCVGRRPASIFAAPGLRFAVLVDGGGIVLQNRPSTRSPALGAEDSKPAINLITDSGGVEAKPAIEVITDFSLQKSGCGPASSCEPYGELIALELERGRNAMGIWQDLVDSHGFGGGYQSVRRYVLKLRGAMPPEARAIIQTAPGEECQVDYGTGPMVRDPDSGKYRRTRLFVLTLGCSRKSVRLLAFRSSARIWAELHEKAFRRLGGTTRLVVLDNLREGVLAPDIYDPRLNPLYRDVLAHYGVTALPCKVRDPDRKGKVESGVAHAQKTPLKGKRFESLEEAQAYLDHWEEHWADTRIHGRTKRQVAAMFAEEKPSLQVLPSSRSVITSTESERSISMVALKSTRLTMVLRRAGSAGRWMCSGTRCSCACLIHAPACCCANIWDRSAAATASAMKIVRGALRCIRIACWPALTRPGPASELCAMPSIIVRPKLECAASWACSRWRRSMAVRLSIRPAPLRWSWV